MALLVVVTGPPGSGKTTLGDYLSWELGLPLLGKDPIKERLADSLGVDGLDWSRRVGEATYELLFDLIRSLLDGGASLIVDANFHPDFARERLGPLAAEHQVVQVVCSARPEVLAWRARERAASGVRHAIHNDRERLDSRDLAAAFERDHAIDIPGAVIRVDTSDGSAVDMAGVLRGVQLAALRDGV